MSTNRTAQSFPSHLATHPHYIPSPLGQVSPFSLQPLQQFPQFQSRVQPTAPSGCERSQGLKPIASVPYPSGNATGSRTHHSHPRVHVTASSTVGGSTYPAPGASLRPTYGIFHANPAEPRYVESVPHHTSKSKARSGCDGSGAGDDGGRSPSQKRRRTEGTSINNNSSSRGSSGSQSSHSSSSRIATPSPSQPSYNFFHAAGVTSDGSPIDGVEISRKIMGFIRQMYRETQVRLVPAPEEEEDGGRPVRRFEFPTKDPVHMWVFHGQSLKKLIELLGGVEFMENVGMWSSIKKGQDKIGETVFMIPKTSKYVKPGTGGVGSEAGWNAEAAAPPSVASGSRGTAGKQSRPSSANVARTDRRNAQTVAPPSASVSQAACPAGYGDMHNIPIASVSQSTPPYYNITAPPSTSSLASNCFGNDREWNEILGDTYAELSKEGYSAWYDTV